MTTDEETCSRWRYNSPRSSVSDDPREANYKLEDLTPEFVIEAPGAALRAADPHAKIIVWAHSGHIARYAWLQKELGLMGATVQKKFPGDYITIGMSSGPGTYSYIKNRFISDDHEFTDSLFTGILQKNKPGSWNELLSENFTDNFYIDFSRLNDSTRVEFEKPKTLKIMGYGKQSTTEKEFYEILLPLLFDILIFLEKTTNTTPLIHGKQQLQP